MKKRIAFLAGIFVVALAAGCGRGPSSDAEAERESEKGTVGVSVLTLTNPFFKELADALADELGKNGYSTTVVSGDLDVAKQQNQLKDFIVQDMAAIVLTPCDSKAIGPAIEEANRAGIPVFTADIACLAPGAQVVAHVATDNYGGGKEAARAMIEALGEEGGQVAVLNHEVIESCILRVKGFKEVIEEHNREHPSAAIEIVTELPGGGLRDPGFRAAQDALQAHSDLDGIFAINDPSALGARAALEKAGRTNVVLVGFDGQPEGKKAIREGKIYADPIQFPERIGRETARAIVRHFSGQEVEPEILIPTALYRREDALKDPALE